MVLYVTGLNRMGAE